MNIFVLPKMPQVVSLWLKFWSYWEFDNIDMHYKVMISLIIYKVLKDIYLINYKVNHVYKQDQISDNYLLTTYLLNLILSYLILSYRT